MAHLVAGAHSVDVGAAAVPEDEVCFIMEVAVASWPCTIVTHNLRDFARTELRFPQIRVRRQPSCCIHSTIDCKGGRAMSGKTSFPLRIQAQERERGKRLAGLWVCQKTACMPS